MWPDDPRRPGGPGSGSGSASGSGPDDLDVVLPFGEEQLDPELAALDAELAKAGELLRRSQARDGRSRPSSAFAADLRARLLAMDVDEGEGAAPADATPAPAGSAAPSTGTDGLQHVHGRLRRRTPSILPSPRWSLLGLAAALVIAVYGLTGGRLLPAPTAAHVMAATGASLTRDGATAPLAANEELRAGDTVSVDATGSASVAIGSGVVRLASGAAIRLDRLDGPVELAQLAGRAWHRVAVQPGTAYTVRVDALAITATGTAFDVARSAGADAAPRVRIAALEHGVTLAAPGLALSLAEGRSATLSLGAAGPSDPDIGPLGADDAADPWLLGNARLDLDAGFPVGWLATALGPTPPPPDGSPTPAPTGETPSEDPGASSDPTASGEGGSPSASATASPEQTATPTPKPTPSATPKPTAKPTPKPTATPPAIGTLGLDAAACGPVASLAWSTYDGASFAKYAVLRGTAAFATPKQLPADGVSIVAAIGDIGATSYGDADLGSASRFYRVVAVDASKRVLAASRLVELNGAGMGSLEPFTATPGATAGSLDVTWASYSGDWACFAYYKVTWSAANPQPSYVGDNDGAVPFGGDATDGTVEPGAGTWYVRVEAVIVTGSNKAILARSEVRQLTIP